MVRSDYIGKGREVVGGSGSALCRWGLYVIRSLTTKNEEDKLFKLG